MNDIRGENPQHHSTAPLHEANKGKESQGGVERKSQKKDLMGKPWGRGVLENPFSTYPAKGIGPGRALEGKIRGDVMVNIWEKKKRTGIY